MRTEIAAFLGLGAVVAIATAVAGCPGSLEDPDRFKACTDPVKDIFTPTCAQSGCHSTADRDASGKLDLEAPNVAERLRGKAATGGPGLLIDPTNPLKSVLLTKLTKPVPFGSPMPLGLPSLSDAQKKCIEDWIVANAGGPPADAGADTSASETGETGGDMDAATDASPE